MGPAPPGWAPKGSGKKRVQAPTEAEALVAAAKAASASATATGAASASGAKETKEGLTGATSRAGVPLVAPAGQRRPSLTIAAPPPCGVFPLRLERAALGWGTGGDSDGSSGGGGSVRSSGSGGSQRSSRGAVEGALLSDVNVVIEKDMRLVVRRDKRMQQRT